MIYYPAAPRGTKAASARGECPRKRAARIGAEGPPRLNLIELLEEVSPQSQVVFGADAKSPPGHRSGMVLATSICCALAALRPPLSTEEMDRLSTINPPSGCIGCGLRAAHCGPTGANIRIADRALTLKSPRAGDAAGSSCAQLIRADGVAAVGRAFFGATRRVVCLVRTPLRAAMCSRGFLYARRSLSLSARRMPFVTLGLLLGDPGATSALLRHVICADRVLLSIPSLYLTLALRAVFPWTCRAIRLPRTSPSCVHGGRAGARHSALGAVDEEERLRTRRQRPLVSGGYV